MNFKKILVSVPKAVNYFDKNLRVFQYLQRQMFIVKGKLSVWNKKLCGHFFFNTENFIYNIIHFRPIFTAGFNKIGFH